MRFPLMPRAALHLAVLALLWVGAQTLLAWHAPSHIETPTGLSHLAQDQDCTLGVNGHGVATVAQLQLSPVVGVTTHSTAYSSPSITAPRARLARARAPPVQA